MKNIKYVFIIILFLFSSMLYSQQLDLEESSTNENKFTHQFFKLSSNRDYIGWLDERSFITRVFLNHNFDLEETFAQIAPLNTLDFSDMLVSVNIKVATEMLFYGNDYFSVGFGGALQMLSYGTKEPSFHAYDLQGNVAAFVDIWLNKLLNVDIKIRIYPVYHQSGHFVDGVVDGFIGKFTQGSSYEFFAINAYYYKAFGLGSITAYTGFEITYRYFYGNGTPLLRAFTGLDYRYKLSQSKDINLVAGFNLGYIYDYQDRNDLLTNNNSVSFTVALGVEIYNAILALKYYYGKPRTVTTYMIEQSQLGLDLSIIF